MSNAQWHDDQATGERALREYKRRSDLDSRLGDALRASGINAADALAVQAIYATAGQSGSHRIVSAMRAIEAWRKGQVVRPSTDPTNEYFLHTLSCPSLILEHRAKAPVQASLDSTCNLR